MLRARDFSLTGEVWRPGKNFLGACSGLKQADRSAQVDNHDGFADSERGAKNRRLHQPRPWQLRRHVRKLTIGTSAVRLAHHGLASIKAIPSNGLG